MAVESRALGIYICLQLPGGNACSPRARTAEQFVYAALTDVALRLELIAERSAAGCYDIPIVTYRRRRRAADAHKHLQIFELHFTIYYA